jgi:hypothetical protein
MPPSFLNGNHRLVGKGLEERDLVICEGAGLDASDAEETDHVSRVTHRYLQETPESSCTGKVRVCRRACIAVKIRDLDHGSIHPVQLSRRETLPVIVERHREERRESGISRFADPRIGCEMDLVSQATEDGARVRAEESLGAPHDRVEDRLQVGG